MATGVLGTNQHPFMNNAKRTMSKSRSKIIAGISAGILFAILGGSPMALAIDSNVSLSDIRKAKIARIIKEFYDAKENLSDPFIQEAIMAKVGSIMTLEPDSKPLSKKLSNVANEARKAAAERYPWTIDQIRKKAVQEAKAKFKSVDRGEYVTVHVQRGRDSQTVSDIFYGYGIGGNSVRIGNKLPIAFVDLSPVDRAKFDASFRKQQQSLYIQKRVRTYYRRKSSCANEIFLRKLRELASENEKRGYIRAWGEWRTPKSVTERFIEQYITRQAAQNIASDTNNNDGTSPDDGAQMPPDSGNDVAMSKTPATQNKPPTVPLTNVDTQLAKLKDKIGSLQMEIASSRYGVDADQGFNFKREKAFVLMGCSGEEVDLLLKKQLPSPNTQPKNGDESIAYATGPVKSVTLSYINDILYKIHVVYRIAPMDIMQDLLARTVERYGKSIETKEFNKKEIERLARLKKIKNLCPKGKHKFNKKGICTKCKVKKADLTQAPEPLEQFHHWKGNVVSAELHFKLSPDKSDFVLFELTKEMPGIKKEQEAILEEERLKREEENKKKIREQYFK